jgi:hypothetical protein
MLFVIGRYFSDFPDLHPERRDGVTWGAWAELVEARQQAQRVDDTQAVMAEMLCRTALSDERNYRPTQEQVGDVTIRYRYPA